jgi:hypothetical protein
MNTTTRTAASLLGLAIFLAVAPAHAQLVQPSQATPPVQLPQSRYDQDWPSVSTGAAWTFHKEQTPPASPVADTKPSFPIAEAPARTLPVWEPARRDLARPLPPSLLALQAPKKDTSPMAAKTNSDESLQYQIPLEPPGPQDIFKLDTEAELYERMRQQARNQNPDNRITFPEEPIVSREKYHGRSFPHAAEVVEPYYVCYRRLLFEDINSERYGWDLGAVQPFVSAGTFFFDLVTVPYHLATRPFDQMECNAGHCLPGDPVPYLAYPPELSITGIAAEGAAAAVLFALFP